MNDSPYTTATNEGRLARRNGRLSTDNPYHPYSPSMAGAWKSGWDDENAVVMDTKWAAGIVYRTKDGGS